MMSKKFSVRVKYVVIGARCNSLCSAVTRVVSGGGLSPDTAYNVSGVTRKQDRKHSQRHHAVFAATAERFFKQGGHRSLKTE